ncbi:MAG: hypothetical protein ACJAT2_000826 [Bacteriovoracaceae bacterium]|jgi:hypothetical protein
MKIQNLNLKLMTLVGSLIFSGLCFGQYKYSESYLDSQTQSYQSGVGMFLPSIYEPAIDADPIFSLGSALGPVKSASDDTHFTLSLDPNVGTVYQPTGNAFLDQYNSYQNRDKAFRFSKDYESPYSFNFFTDTYQSSLFQFSDCKKTCDKNLPNCGWGPLTEKALKTRLAQCGMTIGDLTLEPVLYDKDGRISCHSLTIENPTELESLAQLIGYDCNIQRREGDNDASFCGCILKKAANPKEKLFSPLTAKEKSRIAALTQFDEFQRKTAEIQSSLFQVSKILGAASKDPDTKHLFEGDASDSLACLPGSFDAIGKRFNMKQKDGKFTCGQQGTHRLNAFTKRTILDCADDPSCAKNWQRMNRIKARILKGELHKPISFFRFIQKQSIFDNAGSFSQSAQDLHESNHAAPVLDVITMNKLLCENGPSNEEEKELYNANCNEEVDEQGPKIALANLADVVTFLDIYRNGDYKSIAEFAAFVESDKSNSPRIARVVDGMNDAHRVLKLGVFDTHSNQKTAFAKILSFADNVIPEEIDLNSADAANLNEVSGELGKGFKTSKEQVAKQAMDTCRTTLEELALTCAEMDAKPEDMIKNKPSVFEMTNFSPSGAAERLQSQGDLLGGDIHPITTEALRRKFELYRCGNLMRDPELNQLAFDGETNLDASVFKEVFASVSDPSLKEGLASKVDVTKDRTALDPYAKTKEGKGGIQQFLRDSDDSDFVKLGKAIGNAGKKHSFTGSLKSVSDNALGNSAAESTGPTADSVSTLNNIADMAKNSLQAAAGGGSGDMPSFNSEANYANSLSGFNKEKLESEESKVAQEKKAADERLDVIASRLADLMASKKKNDEARSKKVASTDKETLSSDPKYQEMLIEKLKLEKEIASLGIEKKRKLKAKQEFEQKLSAIESEKAFKAKQAQKVAAAKASSPVKAKASTKGSSTGSSASRKIASVGSGGSSSASGGGSGVGFSSEANSAGSAPYVITLTQDQVTAIKQKFQVVENPNKWVAGGKPPVIREGNIFYELEVADGKIVVPFRKKPLNGFNVAGLRVPASDKEPLPMKIDKKDVKRRRAARVKELNAILDSK